MATTPKRTKTKKRSRAPKKKRPEKSIYDGYLESAAANAKSFGLVRALEICVDMFTYEFQPELKKLKRAAIAALAAQDFAPIVALAKAHGLATFTETDAETMLRGLAGADDHFQLMQE